MQKLTIMCVVTLPLVVCLGGKCRISLLGVSFGLSCKHKCLPASFDLLTNTALLGVVLIWRFMILFFFCKRQNYTANLKKITLLCSLNSYSNLII